MCACVCVGVFSEMDMDIEEEVTTYLEGRFVQSELS